MNPATLAQWKPTQTKIIQGVSSLFITELHMCQSELKRGLQYSPRPIPPPRKGNRQTGSAHAWEWWLRLWTLQICCKTPRRVTNTGYLNNQQYSPAPKGKLKHNTSSRRQCSTAFKLLFVSALNLYLGAGTTSITPPSSHAPCSCQPFFLKEWLFSAIPTGSAQPPHHLYSSWHVSTTAPCWHNLDCTATWTGNLGWKATQGLAEQWKINPGSCLSQKHKSSCARKVTEETVGSQGV